MRRRRRWALRVLTWAALGSPLAVGAFSFGMWAGSWVEPDRAASDGQALEGTLLLDGAEPEGPAEVDRWADVQTQRPKTLRRARTVDPLDAAYPPELDDPLWSLPTDIDDALPPELQLALARIHPPDLERALPPELHPPASPPPPTPDLNAPLPRQYDAAAPGPIPAPAPVDPAERNAPLPPGL